MSVVRRFASIHEALCWAEKELTLALVDSPRLCAELLAAKAFGFSRLGLIVHHKDQPDEASCRTLKALISRRAAGEPAAYILGEKEFFSLAFCVTSHVLIPRPETECIVEEAQRLFAPQAALRFADLGTGSGALAVTIAHEFSQARGLAVDLSPQALSVAKQNAHTHGVEDRLEFFHADFTTLSLAPDSLDLVVANPPYVTESEYLELSPEVREFEPLTALVSPEQGLWHIRGLLPVAAQALRPGGVLLCELGCDQGAAALALAKDLCHEFSEITILKDYAGLDRILKAVKSSQKYST